MKKVLVFLFSFVIGLGLFFLVVEWVGWKEIKEILFAFSGWKGLIILGITLLIWLINIWKYKFIFKSQGYNFSVWSLGEILFASFAVAYLFPTAYFGGEAFKAYAIKKKFFLSWKISLAIIAIEKLLSASVIFLFLVAGTVSFILLSNLPLKNFGIIALVLIGGLAVGLTIFYFKSFKKESILNPVRDTFFFRFLSVLGISNGVKWFFRFFGVKIGKSHLAGEIEKEVFRFFDFRKKLMWKGLGISFLKYFLALVRCWFLVLFLKEEINILIALAVLSFIYLAYVFPFPAKIGSLEAAQVFVFSSLGLGAAAGATFSFILRGAEILIALFGLIFLIKLSVKFFIENKFNRLAP